MGDVFDAMNRGKRQQGQPPAASDAAPDAAPTPEANSGGGDEAGGLPIEQVQGAANQRAAEEREFGRPASARVLEPSVSAAAVKANAEAQARVQARIQQQQQKTAASADNPASDLKLNGYAAQVVVHHDRGSIITEQYRSIRTQILARCRNRRLQTHVITSSSPEEGKSVTTINMGITFSELRDQRTLLLEADLRRPSFEELFDRKCGSGLIQYLRGETDDIESCIHQTVYDNLQFMPAGGRDFTSSTELLSSPRMTTLLDRLRDRYDHIFIDTPPVVTVTDACIMGAKCDQTMLVVRLNRTPVEVVDRAKRLLKAANCEIAGVILTHMQYHVPRYLYRYV